MPNKTQRARANPAFKPRSAVEELCLMAPRQLSNHLRYFAELAALGAETDAAGIAQHWRDARDIYQQLEVSEAGAADDPQIMPLPKSLAAYQAQLEALPAIRNTFNTVPVSFGLVELDKLVVSQFTMTRAIVARLQAALAQRPTPRQLAELCLPLATHGAEFKLAYRDDDEFVFSSDAHDMRFLGAKLVAAAEVTRLAVQGHPQAVVALAVGFSANAMNVVRLGNRLALNNGHHRAYALRAMGITHAPCIIQVCGSQAELSEAATPEICENADLYFESPRPPLLRDFDRPELTRSLVTPPLRRQVSIRIKVESRLLAI